jgi:hypothetical protein
MKSFFAVFTIAVAGLFTYNAVWAADNDVKPKTEKVCNKTTDSKGKSKEVCKTIKIHKKLEGIALPSKK